MKKIGELYPKKAFLYIFVVYTWCMVGFAVHGPGRVHVFGNTQFVLGTKPGRYMISSHYGDWEATNENSEISIHLIPWDSNHH